MSASIFAKYICLRDFCGECTCAQAGLNKGWALAEAECIHIMWAHAYVYTSAYMHGA